MGLVQTTAVPILAATSRSPGCDVTRGAGRLPPWLPGIAPFSGVRRCGRRSAADGRHRPGRLEERRVVDAVPGPLRGERRSHRTREVSVRGAAPQRSAQVALLAREEAVAQLAVGGETDAVTGAAERPADR